MNWQTMTLTELVSKRYLNITDDFAQQLETNGLNTLGAIDEFLCDGKSVTELGLVTVGQGILVDAMKDFFTTNSLDDRSHLYQSEQPAPAEAATDLSGVDGVDNDVLDMIGDTLPDEPSDTDELPDTPRTDEQVDESGAPF